jgi:DNA-directed RNA polymerase subunit RPC12/RpoP
MDYRCPCCGKALGGRKRIGAIVARMEIDCPHCRGRIRLNVHPLEMRIVLAGFGAFVALAALGFALQSQALVVIALAVGAAGPLALPVLERYYFRDWARYVPVTANPGSDPS